MVSVLLVVGCKSSNTGPGSPQTSVVTLPGGTSVPLRLATSLHAGREKEGNHVLLVVDQDVLSNGIVVVPKGTVVMGSISQSRSEGTLSSLMNQPARLAVKVPVLTVQGSDVALELEKGDEFEFDRANTSVASIDLKRQLEDPKSRELLVQLVQSLDSANVSAALEGTAEESLREVAESCGLTELAKASSLQKDSVRTMLDSLSTPQGIARLASGGDLELALQATSQLIRLGESAADRLGKSLKGRTIRAPIGMRIEARTAAPLTVKIATP